MSHSRNSLFRAKILGIIGTGVLVASACGGDTDSSNGTAGTGGAGTGAGPGTGGAPGGTGGAGTGGGGIGGVAGSATGGVAGSGGVAGAIVDSGNNIVCFDETKLAQTCAPPPDGGYTQYSCWGEGGKYVPDAGMWMADAGSECPESILPNNGADCSSYTQPAIQNGECCYVFYPGGGGCGRPFLIGGVPRKAPAVVRNDWNAACEFDACVIDETTRLALADLWLEDARLEHASVASFARFTLELLALGAPADLVADAQRAARDEVEHARLCFALAGRYAERELGPGPLSLAGSFGAISLVDAAARAAREGCVGETLAAIVAGEQLERATDPAVRSALSRIAEDEAVHAELAWRFVMWAIATGGESVRRAVAREFAAAIAEIRRQTANAEREVDVEIFAAHGRLTASEQRAAELRALADVVEPCAKRMTAEAAPQMSEATQTARS